MKKGAVILMLCCGLIVILGLGRSLPVRESGSAATGTVANGELTGVAVSAIRSEFIRFSRSTGLLRVAIQGIGRASVTIDRAKKALADCRLHYKRIEYFLDYFFRSSALIYNNPAKFEVEEPYQEFEAPRGFQVIEALLFDKRVFAAKDRLYQQAVAIDESAADLGPLLYAFAPEDRQLLESLRIELIRIMATGIAGYDAPLLKSGLTESYQALSSIQMALAPYLVAGSKEADSVRWYMDAALARLGGYPDFDRFDRLGFLTGAALPLQHHLGLMIRSLQLELNTAPALNYAAANLFAKDFFNQGAFPHEGSKDPGQEGIKEAEMDSAAGPTVELGRKLFFEKALSGNGSRSCASCHQPEHYFTDGLPKSIAYDNHSRVNRNAPSLLYAGFQYSQFWDGRAKDLEEQVLDVLKNPVEMNADPKLIEERMRPLGMRRICAAIAAYVRSLSPMNSAFDRYISGDRKAMRPGQVRGFNLFMGKAQCGTCHFAPLFNGLVPPLYAKTEYEVLGVPASDDLSKARADPDSGRAAWFPISFYRQAFKTPSLRNAAVTGPYMHNGSFHSLEQVMALYNKGGGRGIGLETPEQTLPAAPLHLSAKEIGQVDAFLRALTDARPTH